MEQKVLFVATVDSHIELFHLPYLKMFKDRGYEVHVATNSDKKIKYCDKKIKLSIKRSPFSFSNLKAIRQLKKIVNAEKYEIIHCHTPMGGVVARLAAKKARRAGTRVIYTAHGFHFYEGAPIKNWVMFYPVEKYLAKYTDTLITINDEDFELAKQKFGKRCYDIQYVPGVGVDEKKFEKRLDEKQKKALRKSLKLKDTDKVLIFPAELSKRKNQKWLIKTLVPLFYEDEKLHLLLPGTDSLNGKCQKLVAKFGLEKQVHILGFRKDISELLQISDIAVSSSKQEGLPVNLMEAAFLGLPIVATDCRGNRDVCEAVGGKIAGQGDTEDFMKYVVRGTELCRKQGVSKYTYSSISEKMEEIYSKEKPVLIIPSCDDLNRGDQALVFETKRLAEQISSQSAFYVMSTGDTTQCEAFGLEKMHDILEHPSRRGNKNTNISYGMAIKLRWGVVAILDLIKSRLLLNKITRPFAKHLYSKEVQKSIRLYEDSKNVFVKGGGFLHDYSGGLIGRYTIYYQLFHIRLALAMGKKVCIMPNSYGPFKSKHTSRVVRKTLEKCFLVTAREGISASGETNGLGLNIDKYPDLAFFLEPRDRSKKVENIFRDNGINLEKDRIVAITIRPYRFYDYDNPTKKYEDYKRTIRKFSTYLVEQGYKVLFVVHTRSKNEHENDEKCIDEVMEKIDSKNIFKIKNDDMDCRDLKKLYGCCDYVVGTRFHSVIFALSQKVPCIAITYGGNKGDGIMQDMELNRYAIKIGDLNYSKIVKTFDAMVKNKEKYEAKIDKYMDKAEREYEKLSLRINGEGEIKMAFFHDAKLKFIDNERVYTNGGLTSNFLKQYTKYFDNVTLVTRRENIDVADTDTLSKCNTERVDFDCVECHGPMSLISRTTRKVVENNVKKADFAVVRLPSIIGLEACKQCERHKKPYLVEVVGDPFDSLWNHGGALHKISAIFVFFANKRAIKRAKNVMYVTDKFLQKRYKNHQNNIGISDVQLPELNQEILQKRINKIKRYNRNTTYKIGLIGSLDVDFKGHDTLIKTVSELKNVYGVKTKVYFLGQCSEERKKYWKKVIAKNGVANNVVYSGTLPGGRDVAEWLDNLDFYVLPSLQEGLPRALLEAMSRGLVSFGTDIGGIPELLDKEAIVHKNDSKTLALKINEVLGDKPILEKYSKDNFDKASLYEKQKLQKKRDQFYVKVLNNAFGGANE